MKVLALSSYGGLGGGELALATFVEHRPAGVEVTALLVSDGPLRQALTAQGIPTTAATGFEGRPSPGRVARFTRHLSPLLARQRPDVVWAIGIKAALLALPACRRRRVPLVWHKIDFSWDSTLARPVGAGVNGVVAVSDAVAAALGPLRRRRLLGVVGPPVGLGPDVEAHPDPERPAIGTLARLVPYKGHHHIIRAAGLLAGEFPGLRVVLAGAPAAEYPTYPSELERLSAELQLADRVEMPGFVTDTGSVLERLSVYVNATFRDAEGFGWEGLSGAMLEASWAGVPVVATRGGGTAEGVVDGTTGTLVDAADPELLAAAIGAYLRDPGLATRTGAAAMRFARERFAPDVLSGRLFELLGAAAVRTPVVPPAEPDAGAPGAGVA